MRGAGHNNQGPRVPFGLGQTSSPSVLGTGRGQMNNMPLMQQQQQQQQMMLLQQQFIARQQIIQQEQLQKQRQLRDAEDKQAGLMAAIQNLQQQTIQSQLRQRSSLPQQLRPPPPPHNARLPLNRPHFPEFVPNRFNQPSPSPQTLPRAQSLNLNVVRHSNPSLVNGPRHSGLPSFKANFPGKVTQSSPTALNNNGTCQSSSSTVAKLGSASPLVMNVSQSPPLSVSAAPRFLVTSSGAQMNRELGTQPLNNALVQSSSNLNMGPSQRFSTATTNISAPKCDNFPNQMSTVGIGASQTNNYMKHMSSDSRPSLLSNSGKSSLRMCPNPGNPVSSTNLKVLSPHTAQNCAGPSQLKSSNLGGRVSNRNNSSTRRDELTDQQSSKSYSAEWSSRETRSRDDRSRERGDDHYRGRDRDRERGRSETWRRHGGDRWSSQRELDRARERDKSSRSRDDSRSRDSSRSNSRSKEMSHSQVDRRRDERDLLDFTVDRTSAASVTRQHGRGRQTPGNVSRERSVSVSRKSVSRDFHSKSKRSLSPQVSHHARRDSSSNRRERTLKRSRSPSDQDRGAVGSQLSQYRQDLLKSEEIEMDSTERYSGKRKKLDIDPKTDYMDLDKEYEMEEPEMSTVTYFTRSCPADLYFTKDSRTGNMEATSRMIDLENRFEEEIVKRAEKVKATQIKVEEPPLHPPVQHNHHHHHHCSGDKSSSCSSSDEDDDDDDDDDEGSCSQIMEEWDRRKKHPYSLHPELWFNMKGQANDGPLCRCSIKSRQSGIRHEIYPGEKPLTYCNDESSNLDHLFHYRITMSPYTNFLTKVPTLINHDNHEYIFEGFSMFSHVKLENIPPCKLLRFNIEYTIHFIPEAAPENFTIRSLSLFNRFIFTEILELIDMDWTGQGEGCNRFHFMPRFCRTLPDSGCKEVLSMNTVLSFMLKSVRPLVDESRLEEIMQCGESEWHSMVDHLRGMIVTNPGMRPSSLRIDQLDRKVTTPIVKVENFGDDSEDEEDKTSEKTEMDAEVKEDKPQDDGGQLKYPLIIHQGYRPAQLSYAGDPVYRKAWKQYVKFRHLLNSKPKILAADKVKLKEQEEKLREIRMKKTMKREVTIELSSKGFLCTGLRADLCQHALMIPVLMSHLRFHICLDVLEDTIDYKFEDRNLLQLSLTHTSYRTNYGTNPDHTRNSLTNCGMRQVEYGDRRIHYQNTRKRGICILVDIMSRLGKQEETASEIPHNERLEFLGDAVIEFLTSVHLFYMFPWLEEGGLTTYRMALVQNQHLAILARKLKLQDFMLYVHGPDLCHESDLRHAMANCFEAIMGALFLDGGIDVVDKIFSKALFDDEGILLHTWNDLPRHVLQQEEPAGDRHWVKSSPILQKLEKFEDMIGVKFTHIRLLAKAFTHRNIGVNPLTLGHNQRLEFLGDTVLQLVASEYLYKHYPEHHEGHLSLLRSSLVNSRTQGLVYDDLGMSEFIICNENAISDGVDMKTKQRADILESFVGALFVDKGLDYSRTFCDVCFFPRLKDFILNQDWNDPKSQLQQCCLTLREVGGGEPDIPVYKVIKSIGPTNTRKYVVAVYFRGKRLARGTGHSIQQAEMAAATQALKKRAELFPILQHQRRFLERMKKGGSLRDDDEEEPSSTKSPKKSRRNQRHRIALRKKAQ